MSKDLNPFDLKKCPECGSKNFEKGWSSDKVHCYKNGKCVSRKTLHLRHATFFCEDCSFESNYLN